MQKHNLMKCHVCGKRYPPLEIKTHIRDDHTEQEVKVWQANQIGKALTMMDLDRCRK